jgi:hypothetical protein
MISSSFENILKREYETANRKGFQMIHVHNLIQMLEDSKYQVRYAVAKSTGTCIGCGKPAQAFSDASAKLEYSVSALCQCCQNRFFNRIELIPQDHG